MLSAFAKFLTRHSKVILAVWVVLILVVFPTAVKVFDRTDSYMTGLSSESSEGEKVLEKYFPGTGISENPVLVITYDSENGYNQLTGYGTAQAEKQFANYLVNWFKTNLTWMSKLDPNCGVCTAISDMSDHSSGIIVVSFIYSDRFTYDDVSDDTDNLRSSVDGVVASYLKEMGVNTKYFNSYVTGNPAINHDSSNDLVSTLAFVVVVVLILAAILMGLFFGSFMTSVISVVSIVFSAVLTMAAVSVLTQYFAIPSVIWLIGMAICVALSFTHNVLFISVYRRQILYCMGKDEALLYTIQKSGKLYLVSGLCLLFFGLMFSMYDGVVLRALGLVIAVTAVSVVVISLFIPAVLISVTKNELFWMRSNDGKYKSKIVERCTPKVDSAFDKVSSITDRFSMRGCVATIAVISILAVASTGYIAVANSNTDTFDMTDSLINGDSEKGLEELEKYGMGGLFQPYDVILESSASLGTVDTGILLKTIQWDADVVSLYKDIRGNLEPRIVASDPNNIAMAITFESWDALVDIHRQTSAQDTINEILNDLAESNVIAHQALKNWMGTEGALLTPDVIVNTCGPRIDYVMNSALANLGYTTDSDGTVHITYIALLVFTEKTCTSDRGQTTTVAIKEVVDDYMKSQSVFSKSYFTGVAVAYKDINDEISAGYVVLVIMAIIIAFFVFLFVEKSFTVPAFILATSAVGALISSAIIVFFIPMIAGALCKITILGIPLFCFTFSLWFGYVQMAMMRDCGSISEMKQRFSPIIIVSSIIMAIAALLLLFSDLGFLKQMGFAIAVLTIVDAFVIRMLFAPAIWRYGVARKIKFFKEYSH